MPDVLCFAKINDVLSHVRRVVGNAFEAFGDNHQMQAAANGVRVFDHVLHEGVDVLCDL